MDDVKLTRKLKITRYLCQYSLTVMIVSIALILISFVIYLQYDLSIGADQLLTLLLISILLIAFSFLLFAEGKNRKRFIGISFLLISSYYIVEFCLVGLSIFEPIYVLQHMIEIVAVTLGIMLCLKTFGRLKSILFWRKVAIIFFVAFTVLQLISYILFGNLKPVEFIMSVAAWIIPQMALYYIGILEFDGKFCSYFIEENPKYFIAPRKPMDRETRRVIAIWIGGGLIVLLIYLAAR